MREFIRRYTIEVEPGTAGGYTVSVPVLPGCYAQGDTYEEAIADAKEAIAWYLQAIRAAGEPIPEEEHPSPLNRATLGVEVTLPILP